MSDEIGLRLQKARIMLDQANELDPATKSEAVIHLCYYAMYHAAVAVLLSRNGTAPSKHGGVISQFGLLVKDDPTARAAGKALNLAYDARLLSDYQFERADLSVHAARLRAEAEEFLRASHRLLK